MSLHEKPSLGLIREARSLFREERYEELLSLLESVERNRYFQSLYERAEKGLELQKKTQVTKKSTEDIEKQKQLDAEKEGISLKRSEEMSTVSKKLYTKMRGKKIEESSKLLVSALEKSDEGEAHEHVEEMRMAQNVQSNLLPPVEKNILPGMDTFVKSISCSELSGDVYDFILANEHETIFYIGDVTGHGTAAGLVMTMISCLSHSIVTRSQKLEEIMATLNREIKPKLQKNMFTTMIMCKWNDALREFHYVGAGHECILHYHARTKKITRVKTGGIAVGMLPDMSKIVKREKIIMENHDVLLLFTDGLTEAWDATKKEMYSLERLEETLKKYANLENADKIGAKILKDVQKFQGENEMTDDMSLMVFKRVKSLDEEKKRQAYLKQELEQALVKDELVMESGSEEFNPELKNTQDHFVRKSLGLAKLYMDEGKLYIAKKTLEKAQSVDMYNAEIQEMYNEVMQKIDAETHKGGLFGVIKKVLWKLLYSIHEGQSKTRRREYVHHLYERTKKELESGNIEQAEALYGTLNAIKAPKGYVKKIQNFLDKSKNREQLEVAALSQFFSLHPEQIRTIEGQRFLPENNPVMQAKSPMKKGSVQFKMSAGAQTNQNIEEETEVGPVNSLYNPAQNLDDNDVLGLKSLLKMKEKPKGEKPEISFEGDIFAKSDEALGTKDAQSSQVLKKEDKKKEELRMEWEKSGVLDRQRKKYNKFMAFVSPMNKDDLFSFVEKLAAFIKAGIPIQSAMEIMQEQALNDGYVYVLDEINKELDKGKLLSQALKKFPQHFSDMLVYIIGAGEKSGALSEILSDLAEQMKEQSVVQRKIRGAMIYPMLIIFASLAMVIGMLIFIVPRLTKVYKNTGVDLPTLTQLIVDVSAYLQTNYLLVIIAIIGTIAGFYFLGKTKVGKHIYHKLYLHLPVVKIITHENNSMLFLTNLAILLENGIQITESLTIVSKITPNVYYQEEVVAIRKRMIDGGMKLAEAMGIRDEEIRKKSNFPIEVLQATAIGEQTGDVAGMLKSSGVLFRDRVNTTVKGLSDILEPVMMIFVGLMVAVILMAIMFPLFNLGRVLRRT